MAERVYRPRWHCRLHLYHRWELRRVSGGEGYYSECRDCGKYNDVGGSGGSVGGSGGGDASVPLG